MKKNVILTLLLLSAGLMAGCSDADVSQSGLEPLHYSLSAPDLIDVCRFDAREAAADPAAFNLVAAVNTAGEALGAALDSDARIRVLLKKVTTPQNYTDNYLIQVATPTGIRSLMARMDAAYESELFALDENAVLAMPFRFAVIPNGESMIHVCMVDPVAYLSQFTAVSEAVRLKLEEAVDRFENIIAATFPDAYLDPRKASRAVASPSGHDPLVTLGQVAGGIDAVSTALETGTLYYNNAAFGGAVNPEIDVNLNGAEDCGDIFDLYENEANRGDIEIRGFVPFGTFKNFRKYDPDPSLDIANMTDTMAFLVENTLIHIFDADKRQVYDVNGTTVYQLLIFDGHVDPMLITRGISRFASVPMGVYLTENGGQVTVRMQNPVFKVLRYYADVTPSNLAAIRSQWNAYDPPSKLAFPDLTLEEFGEFSLHIAQSVFDAAMEAL